MLTVRWLTFAGDPRFDASGSSAVAHLSQTDTLYSLHVRSDLASARRTCIANTVRTDPSSGAGWVASTTVDDALVPVSDPDPHRGRNPPSHTTLQLIVQLCFAVHRRPNLDQTQRPRPPPAPPPPALQLPTRTSLHLTPSRRLHHLPLPTPPPPPRPPPRQVIHVPRPERPRPRARTALACLRPRRLEGAGRVGGGGGGGCNGHAAWIRAEDELWDVERWRGSRRWDAGAGWVCECGAEGEEWECGGGDASVWAGGAAGGGEW